MPTPITDAQRQAVLQKLAEGFDRETIAAIVGVSPGQVSAISAHVKMGTYPLPLLSGGQSAPKSRTANDVVPQGPQPNDQENPVSRSSSILIGTDVETQQAVFWNPDPATGAANPHVLILGESGFGKTYTIACLLAELAERRLHSIVFDNGQGFAENALPNEFLQRVQPVEIQAARDGIDVNPLQIFPTDILGPINVAQRVADTFSRVYTKMGVQQHAVLRQAVLDVFTSAGIAPEVPSTWKQAPPAFRQVYEHLRSAAGDPKHAHSSVAAMVASHISTMFVFNTFRSAGLSLSWEDIFTSDKRLFVLQLKGLELTLARAVTEFLLWNLVGYLQSKGPSPLRCFVVMDEAHRFSFETGSPVETLLREGRKFGIGVLLASQHPEDFSTVAFGNTATKLVFQIADDRSTVTRQLHRRLRSGHTFGHLYTIVTTLPRGTAYVLSNNVGHIVEITEFSKRFAR